MYDSYTIVFFSISIVSRVFARVFCLPLFTVHELFTCFYRLPDTFNKILGDSLRCFHARKIRC